MIESVFNFLSELLYQNFWFSLLSSFLWGILSIILSPCHLTSIPLVIGFISAQGSLSIKKTFSLSLVFAIGILITIAAIGGITLSIGGLIGEIGPAGNYIIAVIFFIVGLYLLDIIKIPWFGLKLNKSKTTGYLAALILGLLFGIGLGPCTFAFMAPVLGVVFEISQNNLAGAIFLLVAFSIGHCFIIVLAGTLTNVVSKYLNWSEKSRLTIYIKRICGLLVILGSFYLIYITF